MVKSPFADRSGRAGKRKKIDQRRPSLVIPGAIANLKRWRGVTGFGMTIFFTMRM
jgi:hypothetical protein